MTIKTRLVVLSLLLLFVLGPCFGPLSRYLASTRGLGQATAWQVVGFIVALAIVLGVVLIWMRQDGQTLADLGWGKPSTWLAIVLGILVGVFWAAFGAMGYKYQFDLEANLLGMSWLRLFTGIVGAGGAILEDMVTRGYLMNELKRIKVPTWLQVVASSLLFALYHSIWCGSLFGFVGSFIASLVYGLILAGLFVLGKRSLTPVILAHSLAVLLGEPFLTMSLIVAMQ